MYNTGNSSKNVTTTSIVDGTISNADVDASAAIVTSKLSGAATDIASHGLASSATTDTTNASNIGSGTLSNSRLSLDISNSDVNASAAIVQSKLATLAITDSEVANDALSGDKIDGGTISNFTSTGIDDNATGEILQISDTGIEVTGTVTADGADLDGAVTINESGADVDFRVESNGSTNMLLVDAGLNQVLIEAQNTESVTDDASLVAATVLSLNGNAGSGSDNIKFGAMSNAGAQFIEATNSTGGAAYKLNLNPINGGDVVIGGDLVSDGDVEIGTTSLSTEAGCLFKADGEGGGIIANQTGTTGPLFYMGNIHASMTTNYRAISFRTSSWGEAGTITITSSTTAYNTSSDYRLKENVVPMTGSIDRLKELNPSRFNFIVDVDKTVDGFLAHEAQEVVPEAITGTKDAMTDEVLYTEDDELPEGKSVGDVKEASVPDYQGIDQSKLVPLLVGALQEAVAKIEELTTRIETLENA